VVVIGVDAHKRTHTASVVEEVTGRARGDVTVAADGDGHLRLLEFAHRHDDQRIWASRIAATSRGRWSGFCSVPARP
jgi:transposase